MSALKILYRIALGSVIIFGLMMWAGSVEAAYLLRTYDLNQVSDGEYIPLDHEYFIAASDCNKRGKRNAELIDVMGGRGGWACYYVEGT